MEHEVNVPFSVGSVRAALAEPDRVARCVPGLQLDSAAGTGSANAKSNGSTTEGRLRVRVGGSTITYRGSLTVASQGEDFTVKGRGTEARGTGSVRLNLTVVPKPSGEGEGTRLVCSGTVRGDGRIKGVERKTATAAGVRMLDRFGKALGESIQENPPGAAPQPSGATGGIGEPGDNDRVIPGIPGPDNRESRTSAEASSDDVAEGEDAADHEQAADQQAADKQAADQDQDQHDAEQEPPERGGIFGTEVPPSSLDPLHDDEPLDEAEAAAAAEAEAAHARRTMIGRSAEEVDHAPPRGRYAPVPVQETIADSVALRWVAPAAAVVVAGAVVIGRALRRRR